MQTPEADAALPPARHRCSPRRRNQWAVTCVDDRGYKSLLAPFLGSLISVAGWRGRIAVFDYGLSAARVARLRELGIHVEPVEQQHLLMVDRFIHLTQFAKQNEGVIGMWDADVWFTEAVDDLFDTYREKHGGRLLCNWDAVFQTSCYDPAHDLATRKRIDRVLLPLLSPSTVPGMNFFPCSRITPCTGRTNCASPLPQRMTLGIGNFLSAASTTAARCCLSGSPLCFEE